jgi:sulfur-carrier protein adenylyltransferase/sulfurtransferase
MSESHNLQEGRFDRHLAMHGFTQAMQDKLEQAKLLVIGAGGLGHPVLAYLAAAGVGQITLMDPDSVHPSNLPRQIFFGNQDLGQSKVQVLAQKINELQAKPVVRPLERKLQKEELADWLPRFDLILDCTDSLDFKYDLSEACKMGRTPLVMGSVDQWQGQVLVMSDEPSAGFADFFPRIGPAVEWGNCTSNGVMGPVVGMIGTCMANEAVKWILGHRGSEDRLLLVDGLNGEFTYIRHRKTTPSDTVITEGSFGHQTMKTIQYNEMLQWRKEGKSFQLIDVREPYEFDEFNLGGELIPMNTVPDHVEAFSRELPVVVHCKAGARSANVIHYLEEKHGFTNLYNLEGGILAAR